MWTRLCPNCNKVLTYTQKQKMIYSEKHNRVCKSCASKKRIHSPQTIQKLKNRWFSPEHREKIRQSKLGSRNPMFGKKHSEEHKSKLRKMFLGRAFSLETRRKLRESTLAILEKQGTIIRQGKNEKQMLDEIEQREGITIDRTFNIIGYKPDGYCHETNTIYEVYEKDHDRQVQKDFERETEICNYLSCDFIIIWDK